MSRAAGQRRERHGHSATDLFVRTSRDTFTSIDERFRHDFRAANHYRPFVAEFRKEGSEDAALCPLDADARQQRYQETENPDNHERMFGKRTYVEAQNEEQQTEGTARARKVTAEQKQRNCKPDRQEGNSYHRQADRHANSPPLRRSLRSSDVMEPRCHQRRAGRLPRVSRTRPPIGCRSTQPSVAGLRGTPARPVGANQAVRSPAPASTHPR